MSIGLFLASAAVLFIGTGYITLDTAYSWTGHFDSSLSGNNRNIALYVLYQLFPLVCLFVFFVLEAILVIRILGELRPMRTSPFFPFENFYILMTFLLILLCSLSYGRWSPFCHRPNFSICYQYPSLSSVRRKDKWSSFRNPIYSSICCYDLDILEQYYRRRLANAGQWNWI